MAIPEMGQIQPENVYMAIQALGLFALSMAFSIEQKRRIRQRDGNKCNFPDPHQCNSEKGLQVHHIIPQRYAKQIGIDPDFEENGITLCEFSHLHLVHPDMNDAQKRYGKDKNAFKKAFEERDRKVRGRVVYWNTTWDRVFHTIVVRNSQRAKKEGIIFPDKHGK